MKSEDTPRCNVHYVPRHRLSNSNSLERYTVPFEFAQELERELATANKLISDLQRERQQTSDSLQLLAIEVKEMKVRVAGVVKQRDDAVSALRFIADNGGKSFDTEYGQITATGFFCAEQANTALINIANTKLTGATPEGESNDR